MKLATVLVAEDEFIVGLDLCETIREAGFAVDGPYCETRTGLEALDANRPDCAVLDVRLADDEVFPLADRLMAADIPVIFHSGHLKGSEIASRYPSATTLGKPCPPVTLIEELRSATGG